MSKILIIVALWDLILISLLGLLWSFLPGLTEMQNFWSFAFCATLILWFTYLQAVKIEERGE